MRSSFPCLVFSLLAGAAFQLVDVQLTWPVVLGFALLPLVLTKVLLVAVGFSRRCGSLPWAEKFAASFAARTECLRARHLTVPLQGSR